MSTSHPAFQEVPLSDEEPEDPQRRSPSITQSGTTQLQQPLTSPTRSSPKRRLDESNIVGDAERRSGRESPLKRFKRDHDHQNGFLQSSAAQSRRASSSPLSEPASEDLSNPPLNEEIPPDFLLDVSLDGSREDSPETALAVAELERETSEDSVLQPPSSPPRKNEPRARTARHRAAARRRSTSPEHLSSPPPQPTRRAARKVATGGTAPAARRQPNRGSFSPDHLLHHPRSRLATCNLMDLLQDERTWAALTPGQQRHLLTKLPLSPTDPLIAPSLSNPHPSQPLPNVMRSYMRSCRSFRTDVRLFQEDLAAGRWEKSWLREATLSSERRAAGVFDSWKERAREDFWGQKQKVNWHAQAGDSAAYSLPQLVRAGCVRVGDSWLLLRRRRDQGVAVRVEKEATVVKVHEDGSLDFEFPPDQLTYAVAGRQNRHLRRIENPAALEKEMLDEDGRIVGVRMANAWKDFHVTRDGSGLGLIWDVREAHYVRVCNQGPAEGEKEGKKGAAEKKKKKEKTKAVKKAKVEKQGIERPRRGQANRYVEEEDDDEDELAC